MSKHRIVVVTGRGLERALARTLAALDHRVIGGGLRQQQTVNGIRCAAQSGSLGEPASPDTAP